MGFRLLCSLARGVPVDEFGIQAGEGAPYFSTPFGNDGERFPQATNVP